MADDNHEKLMRLALTLAKRGQGRVEPNPLVGCVIARDGRVIGGGNHRRFGGPHAEVQALVDCAKRGGNPVGADVYVTLEPCAHHGKTPPCVDALIAAKVCRVFTAIEDPFPEVAGRGLARLREAGIQTTVGLCADEARDLNAPYLKRLATGLPWIIAKWAQTLDGAIATSTGDSQWISNEASRAWVHRLRGRVDAIVIGIGTVLRDDPLLTARNVPIRRSARRVVIDPRLQIPDNCQLLRTLDAEHPLTLAINEALLAERSRRLDQLADQGVEIIGLPARSPASPHLDLHPLFHHLAQARAATNILIEGGSKLLGSLFDQNLVDQLLVFIAPKLLGAHDAIRAVSGLTKPQIANAVPLTLRGMQRIDDDLLLDYRIPPRDRLSPSTSCAKIA